MNCPRCGMTIETADVYCRKCGQELGAPLSTEAPRAGGSHIHFSVRTVKRIVCGRCGKNVPFGEQSCPSCGLAIPSPAEIEAKLQQADGGASASASSAVASQEMNCPHCGKPLDLRDGLCTSCGQSVKLPEIVQEVLQGMASGAPVRIRSQARARARISLSTLGLLVAGLGILVFLAARRPFSFHAASPQHVAGILLVGLSLAMIIVGKLTGSD